MSIPWLFGPNPGFSFSTTGGMSLLFLLIQKTSRTATAMTATMPPITPPTIAPTCVFFLVVVGCAELVGVEAGDVWREEVAVVPEDVEMLALLVELAEVALALNMLRAAEPPQS